MEWKNRQQEQFVSMLQAKISELLQMCIRDSAKCSP